MIVKEKSVGQPVLLSHDFPNDDGSRNAGNEAKNRGEKIQNAQTEGESQHPK